MQDDVEPEELEPGHGGLEPGGPEQGPDGPAVAAAPQADVLVAQAPAPANGGNRQPRVMTKALDNRDALQPPDCSLRLYQNKTGTLFWQGRGPKPEKKSFSRSVTATRDSDACIGEIEARLALHYS